ncbi:MAG: condensation domain-containing protein, partial [Rhodococcus sp. (in: high G+C Gram-positive bacteria)]
MWFAQQLAPEVPVCIAQYVDLRGDLDLDLLTQSIRQAGHEFHSAFLRLTEIDGEPMQIVDHNIDDTVDYLDLRSESDPMAAAKAWIDENYTTPVDLTRDRLVSVWILHVEDHRYLWYSKIHHVALDGYGAMTMVNRTAELYTTALEDREARPCKAADLRTLYDLDNQYRSSSRFDTDREYWADHVGGAADGATLAGKPGPTIAASTLESAALSGDVVAALENSDSTKNATAAAVVIAAFACYLSRMTGRDEVLINIPVSARTTAVLRRSGGMLVNVAPLSIRIDSSDTVGDLVQKVQLELMGALRHQRFSIEDIRRDLTSRGRSSGLVGPMVNVMLFHQEIKLGPIVGEFNIVTSGPVEDLLVNIYQSGSPAKTFVDFRGNPNRYEDEDLAAHHRSFIEVVSAFVAAGPHEGIDGVHPDSAAIGAQRRIEREQLAYWTSALADAPDAVGFPGANPRPALAEAVRREVSTEVAGDVHRRLLADAAGRNSSVLVSAHAALATLLSRLSGESDIVIGARTRSTEGNIVVLRGTVDPAASTTTLTERLHESDVTAFAHAGVTLDDVYERLSLGDDVKNGPIKVLLAFSSGEQPDDLERVDVIVEVGESFDALGVPAGLNIKFVFDGSVHTDDDMRMHAERFAALLAAGVAAPFAAVGDIDILSDSEREALVPVRGGAPVAGRVLSEVLASAVERAGVDAVALVAGERSMSYGELDARSSDVARLLVARGVGVGS